MAGLYIHVPFRDAPRLFDDSYYVVPSASDVAEYTRALASEIRQSTELAEAAELVTTVYIGGGRPGHLPSDSVRALVESLREDIGCQSIEEATVELAPDDATNNRLHELAETGITRISLETLSFLQEEVDALRAPHSAEQSVRAVRQTEETSFDSYSVTLAFGASGQTLATWKASLHRAVDLGVPHVTIREISPAGNQKEPTVDAAECLAFAMTFLQAKGYRQYELTHFARPEHTSRHQRNFYAHGNQLGLGLGAESFWWPNRSDPTTARRWTNVDDLQEYIECIENEESPLGDQESLSRKTLAHEYVMLRLRTKEGVDLDELESRYDVSLRSDHGQFLDRLTREGLIHTDPGSIRLTDRGRLLTDAITQRLLPS